MPVSDLLRWSVLDEEGSVRNSFQRHITHITDRYDGILSSDDDERRTENLLPALKLVGVVKGERI